MLCKKLLKILGLQFTVAPGEAEAECAALQRAGVVDAVLSEDVDTLMFGAGKILRNWSGENLKSKVATHVTIYSAETIEATVQLDREGMVLVALMRGGDYLPGGLESCGIKTGVEVARAGFARKLFRAWGDDKAMQEWRDELQSELATNKSKLFSRRNTRLQIPDDFPNAEVFANYNTPIISPPDKIARIGEAVDWDGVVDVLALRAYTRDTFEWRGTGGAKQFVRVMAPVLLARYMVDNGHKISHAVESIHTRRQHESTDNCEEIRVSFIPSKIIPIDLAREAEDDLLQSTEQAGVLEDDGAEEPGETPLAKYNPDEAVRVWMLEEHVLKGIPERVAEIEAKKKPVKAPSKAKAKAPAKPRAKKPAAAAAATLDRFLVPMAGNIFLREPTPPPLPPMPKQVFGRITKSGVSAPKPRASKPPSSPPPSSRDRVAASPPPPVARGPSPAPPPVQPRDSSAKLPVRRQITTIDLSSPSPPPKKVAPPPSRSSQSTLFPSARSKKPLGQPPNKKPLSQAPIDLDSDEEIVVRKRAVKEKEEPTKQDMVRIMLRKSIPGQWTKLDRSEDGTRGVVYESVPIMDLTGDD